ncbi:MAG: TadE/TadG family type IV pilus assembly protein [Pseudomonadota bacterium]
MRNRSKKRWLKSPIRRLGRDENGATAIEFSILAIPFIMIVFAVLETSLSFTAQEVISNSVDKISRQIRTGQIDATTTTSAQFRQLICDDIKLLVDDTCPELEFDLKSYASFAAVPKTIPMSSPTVLNTTGFTYAPGGSETINHLRVFYRWPVITDIMKQHLAGLEDNKTLLFSSATWQNEPF